MATTDDTSGSSLFILNTSDAPDISPESKHPKMVISAGQTAFVTGQTTFEVPYAPQEITLSALAAGWAQVDRPGRAPLVVPTGRSVPQVSFEFVIASPDGESIAGPIGNLHSITGDPGTYVLIFGMPILEQFGVLAQWRVSACEITVTQLSSGNVPTMASCRMTLLARNDANVKIGPTQSTFTPVTLDEPTTDLATTLAPGTGKKAAEEQAKERTAAGQKPVIVGSKNKGKPKDAGRGNQQTPKAEPTPAPTPKDEPQMASWVADGFYGPNSGGTEPGLSQNRKAWKALAAKLGRASTEMEKVSLEAGYYSFDCPNLGDHVMVKDSAGNHLFVKVVS